MKTLTPPLTQGGHIPRSWREQADRWERYGRDPLARQVREEEVGKGRMTFLLTMALQPSHCYQQYTSPVLMQLVL